MRFFQRLSFCVAALAVAVGAHAAFYVSPDGSDDNPGTEALPFQTIERARDEIRALKEQDALPDTGVEVLIQPGDYAVRQTFKLTAADSGAAGAPIVYRAAGSEPPRFSGGFRLRGFTVVEDADVLHRLPESARGRVWQAGLEEAGVTEVIPFELGGFASGRGFNTKPAMELFVDGAPMTLARWPNEGFVMTGEVPGPLTLTAWDRKPGAPHGRFRFEEDRPRRWINEPDAWLYGYWFWDWADSYERIERIDLEKQEITLEEPWHRYGYRNDQRYYALNLLCELDSPGEWYLDRTRNRVYVYPDGDINTAVVEISATPSSLLELDGASHIEFHGILWETGAADGVLIKDGESCRLVGCTIRKMAGNGVELRGGRQHEIVSCDIHTMGRGGIVLAGGNRKTLTPGDHLVENCRIHHLSRIDRTYTPGVLVSGVGNRIRHNLIYDVASSALRVGGNDHVIEFNEITRVVLESDDQGGADMWGDPTIRGVVYRYNYWHHLGNWESTGDHAAGMRGAIRLDDAICEVLITGNVFHRACGTPTHFGAVQIHGGKENVIESNLFVDCGAAVSFTPWGDKRWREFVAGKLDEPAIDRELYIERYPLLAELEEGHDANTVRENAIVRCDKTLLRAPEVTIASDNRELPEIDLFKTDPGERLQWSAAEAEKLGVGHIEFDKIGLYEDQWRKMRDAQLVLHN